MSDIEVYLPNPDILPIFTIYGGFFHGTTSLISKEGQVIPIRNHYMITRFPYYRFFQVMYKEDSFIILSAFTPDNVEYVDDYEELIKKYTK